MTILVIILQEHLKLQSKMAYVLFLNRTWSILTDVPTAQHGVEEQEEEEEKEEDILVENVYFPKKILVLSTKKMQAYRCHFHTLKNTSPLKCLYGDFTLLNAS